MTSPKCEIYLRVKLVCCQRPKSAVSEYLDIRQLNNPSRRANKKVSLSGKRRNLLKRVPIEGTHAPLCEFRGSSSALFTICVYPKAPYKMMRTYFRCWNVVYPFILAKSAKIHEILVWPNFYFYVLNSDIVCIFKTKK